MLSCSQVHPVNHGRLRVSMVESVIVNSVKMDDTELQGDELTSLGVQTCADVQQTSIFQDLQILKLFSRKDDVKIFWNRVPSERRFARLHRSAHP